jgi:hypothetical protein
MYKLLKNAVLRKADGAFIPFAEGNADYAAYKTWLAAGNVPDPEDVPTFAQLAKPYMVEVRETRERILNRLAGIAANAIIQEDQATAEAVVLARQQLLDITKAPAVLAATTFPELKAAVTLAYKTIAATAPEVIRNAFNTVDA